MKLVTIVGARPQFVKAAAVSRKLRANHTEVLVHTGQHYDPSMSDIFFKELNIPQPDYNLGVGSGSHATQTAAMLVSIENILIVEKPDCLLVYGDTNSTLAGALAAAKLLVPVAHIEAGLRSFNRAMPEEQNRILTDHLSTLLFCPSDTAVCHLQEEGITQGVSNVGDVMCDAVRFYSRDMEMLDHQHFFKRLEGLFGSIPEDLPRWYLATIHRAENTNERFKIKEILNAFEQFNAPVLFPVHPRTQPLVAQLVKEYRYQNILFTRPIGYLDILFFAKHAVKVVTDSGGLQKEAYLLNTPVVTVREQTEWVETLDGNYNVLANVNSADILRKTYDTVVSCEPRQQHYGDGNAVDLICKELQSFCD